jgi:hypothetical protein
MYWDLNAVLGVAYACKFQIRIHLMMGSVIRIMYCVSDQIYLWWLIICGFSFFLDYYGMCCIKLAFLIILFVK